MSNNNRTDSCVNLSPRNYKSEPGDEMSAGNSAAKWKVPPSAENRSPRMDDVDAYGLSASLFGNSVALKAFEKKSGMSIEE